MTNETTRLCLCFFGVLATITAFPEQDNVKKMYDAGADLCLIKPLQFEHFRLEVIRLLNEAGKAASA